MNRHPVRAALVTWALLVGTQVAYAQPALTEFAWTYSFLRASPGAEGGPVRERATLESENLHGTEFDATWFFHERVGVNVSFSYHNGSLTVPVPVQLLPENPQPRSDFTESALMAGPRIRLASNENLTVSARGLVGFSHGDVIVFAGLAGFTESEYAFAASFGGDVTVNITDVVAYRVMQPEVFFTSFGGNTQTNFRISTGIVFH